MKILGHIHTFNDDDVIDLSLQGLLDQTVPLDEIIIVDNKSTDDTLDREFPDKVTVIRHEENLGTSGTVITGFKYAIEHGYDWIWLFDADTRPMPDALEKLLALYKEFPKDTQEKIWILSSLPLEVYDNSANHAQIFDSKGDQIMQPKEGQNYYAFDAAIWTACLYKVQAVQAVGLPSADYVLDWGEFEYGYRGKKLGYKAFMHLESHAHHNLGGQRALHEKTYGFGFFSLKMRELPPIRCYYLVRNTIYFWLYDYPHNKLHNLSMSFLRNVKLTLSFLVRPRTHLKQFWACLRGFYDGFGKRLYRRF